MPTLPERPAILRAKRIAEQMLADALIGARAATPPIEGIGPTFWRKGDRYLVRILASEFYAAARLQLAA